MDKKISEDEFLELEQEIDSAVDRLFRDKVEFQEGTEGGSLLEPTALVEPQPRKLPRKHTPLEGLEAQLLQLEWEVTAENLRKSEEEVKALQREFKGDSRILSVLGMMEGVLQRMIEKGGGVQPSLMKFLLDAKEVLKLFLKPMEEGSTLYPQLLCDGLEARASSLLSSAPAFPKPISPSLDQGADEGPGAQGWKRFEELAEGLRGISERMERILSRLESLLLRVESGKPEPERVGTGEGIPLRVVLFRACGKLYGVEHAKVYKIFRVPEDIWARYGGVQRIRLKDLEVRLIDLGEFFPTERREGPLGERMLLVREDGQYLGFRIEEVVKQLSAPLWGRAQPSSSPVIGHVRWRFANRSVDVPVLDPGRF